MRALFTLIEPSCLPRSDALSGPISGSKPISGLSGGSFSSFSPPFGYCPESPQGAVNYTFALEKSIVVVPTTIVYPDRVEFDLTRTYRSWEGTALTSDIRKPFFRHCRHLNTGGCQWCHDSSRDILIHSSSLFSYGLIEQDL